jgi:hypothetical protein
VSIAVATATTFVLKKMESLLVSFIAGAVHIIAMWSLGIGLVVVTVDELIGGVIPSAPED